MPIAIAKLLLAIALSVPCLLVATALMASCGGDDTTASYLGESDASPPRLGPSGDAGAGE
jgi:hypothetical protein